MKITEDRVGEDIRFIDRQSGLRKRFLSRQSNLVSAAVFSSYHWFCDPYTTILVLQQQNLRSCEQSLSLLTRYVGETKIASHSFGSLLARLCTSTRCHSRSHSLPLPPKMETKNRLQRSPPQSAPQRRLPIMQTQSNSHTRRRTCSLYRALTCRMSSD